ncbi:hypothetical protein [Qaidamihabitans albus]|uniref:hypothetical protein n=1 Tax=Qaidamihabitans albus TaxID=2795733 RepID=UPI0018F1D7A0|nr:hypothetical protein [Qaidamihabitans albus]
MRRAALLALVTLVLLAAGTASQAFGPVPLPAADPAGPHRIHITVSGPADALMQVVRGQTRTQVALRGEPFDFEFTEPHRPDGYPDIAVHAMSTLPSPEPLTCRIEVDGVTVAEQSVTEPGASGRAEVSCEIPASI